MNIHHMKKGTAIKSMKFILTSFLCISSIIVTSSCSRDKNNGKTSAPPDIEVARPMIDSVTLHKTYPGTLSSEDAIEVVGRVNGQLISQNYKEGTFVKKGDVLYRIEDSRYRDAVRQAQASLATAKSRLDYCTRNFAAMSKALESDAVSQMEVIQARANMEEAQAAVENASASLSLARTNLAYCTVTAPISGIISASRLQPGAYVGGEDSPVVLATIYNNNKLAAVFNIEESQYEKMLGVIGGIDAELYRKVPIDFRNRLPHEYTADLYFESPAVESSTGTLVLKGWIENPYNELKQGMYCTVSLPYDQLKDAMLIRDASISSDQLGNYVYVVNDSNKIVYTPIKTGDLVRDSLRIVTSGLTPESRYVTKALLSVRNGMEVNPVNQSK